MYFYLSCIVKKKKCWLVKNGYFIVIIFFFFINRDFEQCVNSLILTSALHLLVLELKRILQEKLEKEIPVITVVSVMGTTEESAVDPLTEILEMRQKFRTKVRRT